jgi:hypothetical protein
MNVVWEGRKHVLTVLRTDRSIPVQDAHKPKAKKAPVKKGKGKAAGTKRKAPASRSRSGSRWPRSHAAFERETHNCLR